MSRQIGIDPRHLATTEPAGKVYVEVFRATWKVGDPNDLISMVKEATYWLEDKPDGWQPIDLERNDEEGWERFCIVREGTPQ